MSAITLLAARTWLCYSTANGIDNKAKRNRISSLEPGGVLITDILDNPANFGQGLGTTEREMKPTRWGRGNRGDIPGRHLQLDLA